MNEVCPVTVNIEQNFLMLGICSQSLIQFSVLRLGQEEQNTFTRYFMRSNILF